MDIHLNLTIGVNIIDGNINICTKFNNCIQGEISKHSGFAFTTLFVEIRCGSDIRHTKNLVQMAERDTVNLELSPLEVFQKEARIRIEMTEINIWLHPAVIGVRPQVGDQFGKVQRNPTRQPFRSTHEPKEGLI